MERLTRKETVIARGVETVVCNHENADCDDRCRYGTCRWQNKANMRLKEYEDTGLTPPGIMELKERDTARKPDLEGDGCDKDGNIIYDTWICPNCGERYEIDYGVYNFCPKCGQKIDESEIKELEV